MTGPLVINREWGKRRVVVTTNVVGRDLGSFVSEASDKIEATMGDELRKSGCRIEFGGQYENLVRASKTLSYRRAPSRCCLILILVYSTYGNIRDSLRVFTGVPFSLVGGVLALHFRHMPFSISGGGRLHRALGRGGPRTRSSWSRRSGNWRRAGCRGWRRSGRPQSAGFVRSS